jgi:hypothetical protein
MSKKSSKTNKTWKELSWKRQRVLKEAQDLQLANLKWVEE